MTRSSWHSTKSKPARSKFFLLQIGADNAVTLTGRPAAYFGNKAIKILLPKNLRFLGVLFLDRSMLPTGPGQISVVALESRSIRGCEL
jgi:hypothetical protein